MEIFTPSYPLLLVELFEKSDNLGKAFTQNMGYNVMALKNSEDGLQVLVINDVGRFAWIDADRARFAVVQVIQIQQPMAGGPIDLSALARRRPS